jgi:hypothetical protein
MKDQHDSYRQKECGLFLNTCYPAFGASPDGIVPSICCGNDCVEVKCPYSLSKMNCKRKQPPGIRCFARVYAIAHGTFILDTDASDLAVRAQLWQTQDGVNHPLCLATYPTQLLFYTKSTTAYLGDRPVCS